MPDDVRGFDSIAREYDRSRVLPADVLAASLRDGFSALGLGASPRALDCGCGTGQIAVSLASLGCSVVGVDPSPESLKVAREKLGARATLIVGRGEDLPFSDREFDVVIVAHLLEHVVGWRAVVAECLRVCRDGGGVIFIFSPGFIRNGPRSSLIELLRRDGVLPPRPGLVERNDLLLSLRGLGAVVEPMTSEGWKWGRSVRIRESLEALDRRLSSRFWGVPSAAFRRSLALVCDEFAGREDEVEEVTAAIELIVARKPH